MGLRFDPIGGGQFKAAAQALIDAESQPLKALNGHKGKEEARLKLFQEFKTKFSGLERSVAEISSFRKFRDLKVDLGDGADLMSVTVQKDFAEPGQYQFEIDELAVRSATISNGFESAEAPLLGEGYIDMPTLEGGRSEIYVDSKDSSLQGIAKQINRYGNAAYRAAVVKDASEIDNPWKLIITARKDGKGGMEEPPSPPELYFMNGDISFEVDDDREATNASVQVNGFPIELESNDVNDFLPGVNIHLKHARPDNPFTVTITEDYQKISGKMKTIVDQINQILMFIQKQNQVDANSDTSTTFAGDGTLQGIEMRLRSQLQKGYTGVDYLTDQESVVHLSDLGVEFQKGGTLSFREDKFQKALEKNFDLVARAISGPNGFAEEMMNVIHGYTMADGLLNIKEAALREKIKQMDRQIDDRNRIIEQKKRMITDKFARLEGTLGNLQRQGQYMSAALAGSGGGGNPISQLLGG